MTSSFPEVPDSTLTEREGINYVGLIASRIGLVWRELVNTDLGIDGYLEVVVNGVPIGLVAVQVKSGPSYIESPNPTNFTLRAESKHVRYWLRYRLPVIIVVYNPLDSVAYWYYIQDYFNENDDVPQTNSVPIRISKLAIFGDEAKERLVEIASAPDSTAHAMLALRASRYKYTQELLTQRETVELYAKRKWLGEWLPLDIEREQLLMHSTLARRGPAWYWFRIGTNRDYIPYLRSGVRHPDVTIQDESALALAAAIGREAIEDLDWLLTHGSDKVGTAEALALITNLTSDDRRRILETCWQQYEGNKTWWSRDISLGFLSLMARIGGPEEREGIITQYQSSYAPLRSVIQTGVVRAPFLKSAGRLWNTHDLPNLRQLLEAEQPGIVDLAAVALAQLGEKQDCMLILNYIEMSEPNLSMEGLSWLSDEAAHLFDREHLESLKELLHGPRSLQIAAHHVLPNLCCRLEESILVGMLADPDPNIRSYAASGLAMTGRASALLSHETTLLTNTDALSALRSAEALTTTGNWTIIERLVASGDPNMCRGVTRGLRLVRDERSDNYLLSVLQNSEMFDISGQLEAANSLSIIGSEETLLRVLEWVLEHPYESNTQLMASVLIYLDRKLYCPIEWPERRERDFSIMRYSVTRDDYR